MVLYNIVLYIMNTWRRISAAFEVYMSNNKKNKILIVDDVVSNRMLLSVVFSGLYDTAEAETSGSAQNPALG